MAPDAPVLADSRGYPPIGAGSDEYSQPVADCRKLSQNVATVTCFTIMPCIFRRRVGAITARPGRTGRSRPPTSCVRRIVCRDVNILSTLPAVTRFVRAAAVELSARPAVSAGAAGTKKSEFFSANRAAPCSPARADRYVPPAGHKHTSRPKHWLRSPEKPRSPAPGLVQARPTRPSGSPRRHTRGCGPVQHQWPEAR